MLPARRVAPNFFMIESMEKSSSSSCIGAGIALFGPGLPGPFDTLALAGELLSRCSSNIALAAETLAGAEGEGGEFAFTAAEDCGRSLPRFPLPSCTAGSAGRGGEFSTVCAAVTVPVSPSVSLALTVRAPLTPPGGGCFAMKFATICV